MSTLSLHAVILPFPFQGHITPLLAIARLLASHGFSISFILPPSPAPTPPPSPHITFISLPDLAPPQQPLQAPQQQQQHEDEAHESSEPLLLAYHSMLRMQAAFEEHLLPTLSPPVSCLIADTFVTWSHLSARRFGIPRFAFGTSNAHIISLVLHAPALRARGVLPFQESSYGDPDYVVDSIPGVPPLRPIDFPFSIRFRLQFVLDQAGGMQNDDGILFNTFYEMEKEALDAVQSQIPVYPIGPLLLFDGENNSNTMSYWTENTECIKWLDEQGPSSVLYVSFGSLASFTAPQLKELAQGLEASEQPFLWVIRPDSVKGLLTEVLPEDFEARTRDRGMIISWAPQLRVLAHPSVGGFLTHCGWNSLTENLCTGAIPMICWPNGAEQRLNCRLMVDTWKIGMELHQGEDGFVNKKEVERVVRALMQGGGEGDLKNRARKLKEAARGAVQEGGSSFKYLQAFVDAIKKKAQQKV